MAHWRIEDHGFGGQTHWCSECGGCWNDIYYEVSSWDFCPNCNEPIDEGATEYIEFARIYMNKPYTERVFAELENKLIQVSGFDVEKLIELFAAGYTLHPPKNRDMTKILGDLV